MKRLSDWLVILIYCFGTVLSQKADTAFLVAFLCAVIYASACYYSSKKCITFLLSTAFIPLFMVNHAFALFFPVILYGLLEHRSRLLIAAEGTIALLALRHSYSLICFFLIPGCMIATLLQSRSAENEYLTQAYKKTRDDSVERNLLLKEKNQALLEKQNSEIYAATLKERNRIAREIHDNVGHMLSRAILMTGAIRALNQEDTLKPHLEQLESTLNTAMNNVRESVHDLHDESINLKEALTEIVNSFTFCRLTLEYDMGYEVPRTVKYSFISIVKEALNNISRHSNATSASIIVREHPGIYQLIIEDNGTTATAGSCSDGKPGNPDDQDFSCSTQQLGLTNMQERINALNGHIQIQTKHGFRIFITIPKKEDFLT